MILREGGHVLGGLQLGTYTGLELGRYRFFKSVSVFGFLVGFSKVGFGVGFSKYRDIGFGFRFFRTNLPLLIE